MSSLKGERMKLPMSYYEQLLAKAGQRFIRIDLEEVEQLMGMKWFIEQQKKNREMEKRMSELKEAIKNLAKKMKIKKKRAITTITFGGRGK